MLPKFRVWYNVHEGKMYPVQSLITNQDGSITVNATDNPTDWNPIQVSGKWQTGYLMLFTGEMDKTGKEICEGDVVEVETTGMNYRSDLEKGVVEYIDGCFDVTFNEPIFDKSIDFWRKRLYVKCFVVNHAIKIIGNIYENPEHIAAKDAQGRVTKSHAPRFEKRGMTLSMSA
jgi:uncharacterized phage protein (TIGR01671 family)